MSSQPPPASRLPQNPFSRTSVPHVPPPPPPGASVLHTLVVGLVARPPACFFSFGTGLQFRETPGDYDFDFHCAPARQFVVSLDAGVEIEVADGTRRVFPAGTVMLAEDTWGKVSTMSPA